MGIYGDIVLIYCYCMRMYTIVYIYIYNTFIYTIVPPIIIFPVYLHYIPPLYSHFIQVRSPSFRSPTPSDCCWETSQMPSQPRIHRLPGLNGSAVHPSKKLGNININPHHTARAGHWPVCLLSPETDHKLHWKGDEKYRLTRPRVTWSTETGAIISAVWLSGLMKPTKTRISFAILYLVDGFRPSQIDVLNGNNPPHSNQCVILPLELARLEPVTVNIKVLIPPLLYKDCQYCLDSSSNMRFPTCTILHLTDLQCSEFGRSMADLRPKRHSWNFVDVRDTRHLQAEAIWIEGHLGHLYIIYIYIYILWYSNMAMEIHHA